MFKIVMSCLVLMTVCFTFVSVMIQRKPLFFMFNMVMAGLVMMAVCFMFNMVMPGLMLMAVCYVSVMIERKPLFFMFNMVMPCLMLMAVGVLAFFLPPDTGEKIALCTTVLLTLVLFQIMLSDFLPPTSDVIPLLSELYVRNSY